MDPLHQDDMLVKCIQSCHSSSKVQRQQARLEWTTALADSGEQKSNAGRRILQSTNPWLHSLRLDHAGLKISIKMVQQSLPDNSLSEMILSFFKRRRQKQNWCIILQVVQRKETFLLLQSQSEVSGLVLFPRLNNTSSSLELCISWH